MLNVTIKPIRRKCIICSQAFSPGEKMTYCWQCEDPMHQGCASIYTDPQGEDHPECERCHEYPLSSCRPKA